MDVSKLRIGVMTSGGDSPGMNAALRAVVPLRPGVALASRLTLEAPRRIDRLTNAETDWALVADLVLSGDLGEGGLRWNAGVYNVFNWRYALPAATSFAAPVTPQLGRSLVLKLTQAF